MTISRPRAPRPLVSILALVVLAVAATAPPAGAVKFVDYNLLNYDNLASTRDPAFRTVFSSIADVDVIAAEEVQDNTAATNFLNNVLNVIEPGQWAKATYFDDPTQSFNQCLFYRPSAVTVVAADTLGSDPRDIAWYTLRPVGYSASAAEFTVFVVHYKASNTSSDQATRLEETTRLRNYLNANFSTADNFLICGDMNIYTSTEAAYQMMVGSQTNNNGRVFDPINSPGAWNNNGSFSHIHTQSTRTGLLSPGDGGATGGMDDRFDQILTSLALGDGEGLDQIVSTYKAYGQDGNHFNLAISDAPTIPEGQTVADALERASDHLPVVVQFQVPAKVLADASLSFGTVIVGATAQQTLNVSNDAAAPADELSYTLVAPVGFTVPGGPFTDETGGGGNAHTVTMLTASAGVKGGNLSVSSDDVDNPSVPVALSGTVLRHAVPSLASGGAVDTATVDFGSFSEGDFVDAGASLHNDGHDALQALLNVYDAQITDPSGRFSIVGGFNPVNVGGTPSAVTLHFDDTGAGGTTDSTFVATLVFSTRDEQGIPGATALGDLTVTLRATVLANVTQTGVGDDRMPLVTRLAAGSPNPFRAATRLAFDLATDAPVSLVVFDVQGRRVTTLIDRPMSAGTHAVSWSGIDDAGRETPRGIYFAVLETPSYRGAMRLVKLR